MGVTDDGRDGADDRPPGTASEASAAATLRHANAVAVVELRRRLRRVLGDRRQLLAYALSGLVAAAMIAVAVAAAYVGGAGLRRGEVDAAVTVARYALAAVWVGVLGFAAFRTVARSDRLRGPQLDGLLTTIPHRDVAVGLVLAEVALVLGGIAVPVFAVAAAFGLGANSPASVPLVATAVFGPAALGLIAGFAVGMGANAVFVRSARLARHKLTLGVGLFVAYVLLLITERIAAVVGPVVEAFRYSPIGWYADLALVTTVPEANPLLATVAAALTIPAAVGLTALAARLAGLYWYADPPDDGSGRAVAAGGAAERIVDAVLAPVASRLDRPTAAVARKNLRRSQRAPLKMVYVVYPAILLVQPVGDVAATGRVPASLVPATALYGAWATGAAFALNPLGDEGATLPTTLTAPVSGRQVIDGYLLPGLLVGTPVAALGTLAVALASPLGTAAAVAAALAATALCGAAAALAAAAGTAFPRFEAAHLFASRSAVVPSMWAFLAYSIGVSLIWIPGSIVGAPEVARRVGAATGLGSTGVVLAGLGLATLLAAVAGRAGYRYAAGTVEGYTL